MLEIQNKKKIDDSTALKKQKWIKKWEPHRHCSVCGLAIESEKEFCSSKCSGEYDEWKVEQEKKQKRSTMMTFILMIAMIIIMFVLVPMFSG